LGRIAVGVAGLAVLLAGLPGLWFWHNLAASTPILEGKVTLPGLALPVEVQRDASGMPTVTAGNRLDLARALGFLHAQERFFQMDSLRRAGAGELCGLFGEAAMKIDEARRLHRFRARAAGILAQMPGAHRLLLDAYTEGVNAGLAALSRKPFEYTLLQAEPRPWHPEDTLLVAYAMYFQLQDSTGWPQRRRALAEKTLGPSLAAFLYSSGDPDGAALDGSVLPEPPQPEPAIAPSLSVPAPPAAPINGSNAFAVAASRSKSGHAIVANDMHLPLRVPNIWYRARLRVREGDAPPLELAGVTLPGTPLLVAGSNGKIAWGFTNSNIVTSDVITLEPVPGHPLGYATPNGPLSLSVTAEQICPAGGACRTLEVEESIWGPVIAREADGTRMVLRWTAHDTNAIDYSGLFGFESAATLREGFDAAHKAGLPQQNLVMVDREGHIGWTIIGQIPKRVGLDDDVPQSWADGSRGWKGYLSAGEVPEILDPPDGIIWSANNRAVGGAALALLGDGGYASAARARRIRDDLQAKDRFTEADLLAIQLDVHAQVLKPWQELLVELLKKQTDPMARSMLSYAESWGEAAVPPSIGYRLVRSFEEDAIALIYGGFGGAIKALAGPSAGTVTARRAEWPSLRLLTARPDRLIPPPFKSWDEVMQALYGRLVARIGNEAGGDLSQFTWGNRNRAAIHHPLAAALPWLGLLTDPADIALPGDTLVPCAASPGHGASERFVVSPGHESSGIFEMPVGQGGNPLTPYYLAGQSDWVEGRASAFLPGPPRWTLVLTP
jgi:penicillin amidase